MFVTEQADFSGGIWRGRRAPENAVYDHIDGLYNDEGEAFKRGGSATKSADAGSAVHSLWDGILVGGARTVFVGADTFALAADDTTVSTVSILGPSEPTRLVDSGGVVFILVSGAGADASYLAYAGSRKSANYSTGTVTLTQDSDIVTGAGTSWLANADAGMFLQTAFGYLPVAEVLSDTSLRLRDPHADVTTAGMAYTLTPVGNFSWAKKTPGLRHVLGTAAGRLLMGLGSKMWFGEPGQVQIADEQAFHTMDDGSTITGIAGLGNSAVVFTTTGVFTVSNLDLDPFDAVGNIQHQVQRVSGDVILWDELGLAGWDGRLLVPAIDDVYVFSAGGSAQAVSEAIRPLYRSYLAAGYRLGRAAVHRGHLMLPVRNGSTAVDTLVSRLDRGSAWSRWAGEARGLAYAQRVGGDVRSPALLGLYGNRVMDLTGCFVPTNANRMDAGGGAPAWSLTTRDFDTGPGIRGGLLRHVRAEYDLIASSALAAITVGSATGAEGSAFTTLAETAPEGDGVAKAWMVNRFGERVRLRFECPHATDALRLRRLELHMQESQRP